MQSLNKYFNVFPRVVRANSKETINIEPLYDNVKPSGCAKYKVTHYPVDYPATGKGDELEDSNIIEPIDGCLQIERYFEGEQEHILLIEEMVDSEVARQVEFRVYSLEEDLFSRKPYKGDVHMHTYHSDGRETPAYLTAACRKIGFDFISITDHEKYYPSIEAQEAFEDVDVDIGIYRGEEVHPPDNIVHMVNFGGDFSVNEIFQQDELTYKKEVSAIEKGFSHIEDETLRRQLASCTWCYEKIREGGGLGIFCHPFWRIKSGYHVSTKMTELLYEYQPFDALEVIGGFHRHQLESNVLQVASYNDQRAKGKNFPIVGVSDSHGCESGSLFGWYYTIVFAKNLTLNDLVDSIKDNYSVAMEAVEGERTWAHGDFRLVKYALFLEREVFPYHDDLCKVEGELMHEYIKGDNGAKGELARRKGNVSRLYNMLWA
ncbi:MAG: hypothetical protein GX974_02625 [Clostridiales bacterium]|nr:hypothetical protein [Clostridiales bacterium]